MRAAYPQIGTRRTLCEYFVPFMPSSSVSALSTEIHTDVRKEYIEELVDGLLRHILADTENRASLAADISDYYQRAYVDTHYLDGLRDELARTTRALENLVRAIEQGLPFTDSVAVRLTENEERKKALAEAIEAEEARSRAAQDETSIGTFFEKYSHADFGNPEMRETLLDYFIDRIYLYDNHLVVVGWYWDINHEVLDYEVEGLKGDEAAFEYVLDLSRGFECFAPECTTEYEAPHYGGAFLLGECVRRSFV